jgi:glycosyltransferase involved in cell wall biosynthesis
MSAGGIKANDLGRAVLYFGNDWDAENRTSSHQIALQLRHWSELIYIECPGLRPPAAKGRDARKLIDKIRKACRGPRERDGMRIHTLLQLPFHGNALMRWINERIVKLQVDRIARNLRHKTAPVLWFAVPHISYLPRLLPDCASVYYCVDKFAALPGVDAVAVQRMDEVLTRAASLVFVASETLLSGKVRVRPDCILSPHGVDFELFSSAAAIGDTPRPADLPRWPGPVIGFFGSLESWIDLELVALLAQQRPQWLIVLIGHAAVDVSKLRRYPNVVLTGRKKFNQLPGYGRFFDVCMLPYLPTEQVINSNPIKLREYLAMGKPVVSVRFPHAEQFSELIYIAAGRDDFVVQTERALREDSAELRAQRMDSVRGSTWKARAHEAFERVALHLSQADAVGLDPNKRSA